MRRPSASGPHRFANVALAKLRDFADNLCGAAQHGPRSFGLFSCSKSTNETNFVAQKFARSVIGSNNIDSCNRT